MKVLLINGSPHKEGCTYTALKEVADTLEANGIKTEMMYLGVKPIAGRFRRSRSGAFRLHGPVAALDHRRTGRSSPVA